MRRALPALAILIGACSFGESGVAPPSDRLFFPAGVAVDPDGAWLYVVNSNSDLRFNAGTVAALDLRKAAEDRASTTWSSCPRNTYVPGRDEVPARFCCRNFVDARTIDCDERGYVDPTATVRIGSFGGTVLAQRTPAGGGVRRLFVAVRAEPSITFVDGLVGADHVRLRCTTADQDNLFCDDAWRVKQGGPDPLNPIKLPEEPYGMTLDPVLGVLYVAHLNTATTTGSTPGGVSVIDTCAPHGEPPRLLTVDTQVFPSLGLQAATTVTPIAPGKPDAPLYATSRWSADVAELRLTGLAPTDCTRADAPPRDTSGVDLVPGVGFYASAFSARTSDLRGLLFSADGTRAWVLNRQYENSRTGDFTPPALLAVDRTPGAQGQPVNRTTNVLEVCRGPTRMREHDAGRGPRLYVNCFEGGQIYVVDPALFEAEAIIEAGHGPAEIVFSPSDPTVAYVAGFADNVVSVLDLKPGSATEYRVVQHLGFPRPGNIPPK